MSLDAAATKPHEKLAEALAEEAFADLAAVHFGAGEDGLEVHGLPCGPGFDVLRFECETDLLAGDAGNLRIDGQAGQPAGGLAPGSLGLHGHAGQRFERFGVRFEMAAAAGNFAGEARELTEPDAGSDIAEAIVIADGGMLVMRSSIPGLGRQEARLLRQFRIIGDEHAPATGGDDFVTVKGMDTGQSERTG